MDAKLIKLLALSGFILANVVNKRWQKIFLKADKNVKSNAQNVLNKILLIIRASIFLKLNKNKNNMIILKKNLV